MTPIEIKLTPTQMHELEILYFQQQEPEANLMAAFPARDYFSFMQHWNQNILSKANCNAYSIYYQDKLAGNILSWSQEEKTYVGYWIGKEYWGKGIASQALTKLLEIITNRPLYAYVVEHNKGSIRVLEKLNFKYYSIEKLNSSTHSEPIYELLYRLE